MTAITRTPTSVAIVAFFESARMAKLLPPAAATELAAIHTTGGIPANWLTEALVSKHIRTTVIGNVRGASRMMVRSPMLNVGIYPGSGGWPFVRDGRRKEREAIRSMLEEVQPELVHAMWTLEGGRAVADWNGPKVLTVHDAAWEYARLGLNLHPINLAYSARWLYNTSATLAGFQHLIAVSPFVENYLRQRHNYRGTIRVIPNAVPKLAAGIEVKQGFPKSRIVTFGTYGGPGAIKNVLTAISAFRLLQRSMSEIRLQVFGGGWSQNEIQELGGSGVIFRGAMLHDAFLRAMSEEIDIWVHPARIEAHPISICEAIQCGCAMIAGENSGGVAWTLDHGRSGLLVDVERPAAIAEAMQTLVTDRVTADAIIAHGQHFIREHFSPEVALERHLAYYEEILNAPGKG